MEENKQSINELLKIAMSSLKQMTDVNIIIGDKVICNDITIIPISKVKCGFISGGVDQVRQYEINQSPFGGGAGGSLSITPVAFLVTTKDDVRVLHLEESSHMFEKIIDFIPCTFDKIMKTIRKDSN